MRWLALALCVAGCGGSSSNSDGGHDFSMGTHPDLMTSAPPDQTVLADLAMLPDLAVPDFATPPDMIKVALKDFAGSDGPPMCDASSGYAGMGMNGMQSCGEQGMCDGHKFTLDCDGVNCTCAIDGQSTNVFPQGNTCNNVDGGWKVECGF